MLTCHLGTLYAAKLHGPAITSSSQLHRVRPLGLHWQHLGCAEPWQSALLQCCACKALQVQCRQHADARYVQPSLEEWLASQGSSTHPQCP